MKRTKSERDRKRLCVCVCVCVCECVCVSECLLINVCEWAGQPLGMRVSVCLLNQKPALHLGYNKALETLDLSEILGGLRNTFNFDTATSG